MKKLVSSLLVIVLALGLITPHANAADKTDTSKAIQAVKELKDLKILRGTNPEAELNQLASRLDAIIVISRLINEEERALDSAGGYPDLFKDVPSWARGYAIYAYETGLTSGIGNGKFGAYNPITSKQFITMMLKAMGYSSTESDDGHYPPKGKYSVANPYDFAAEIGLIKAGQYSDNSKLTKADMYIIADNALYITANHTTQVWKYYLTGDKTLWKNTKGEVGDCYTKGCMLTPSDKLQVLNKDVEFLVNENRLNYQLGDEYQLVYHHEMTNDNMNFLPLQFTQDIDTGYYGMKIGGWNKKVRAGTNVTNVFNAVLETFYFLCGDKEVAYALWSWYDAKYMFGYSNTDDFGFKDLAWTNDVGGTITMNGIIIDIEFDKQGKTERVYFH